VWNFSNAAGYKAARPFSGQPRWLSAFDLDKLTAGATECFDHIGSDTIQRVNAEFATRRKQFRKAKLRWRVSKGPKKSLGWVPFKAVQLRRNGKSLRFAGKAFRVFEREQLEGAVWKSGCFAQDAVGDWWLCLPVAQEVVVTVAPHEVVGLDLGLREAVATSDGDKLEAGISIGPSSEKSQTPSAVVIIVRLSVCTAPLPGDEKMLYTNSQEESSTNIRP